MELSVIATGLWVATGCTMFGISPVLMALCVVEWVLEFVSAIRGPESRHLPLHRRIAAATLAPLIKNVVDLGHSVFHLKEGRPRYALFHRFDWFLGQGTLVRDERVKFGQRMGLWCVALALILNGSSTDLGLPIVGVDSAMVHLVTAAWGLVGRGDK